MHGKQENRLTLCYGGGCFFQNNGNLLWKIVEDLYYGDVEKGGIYLNKKLT